VYATSDFLSISTNMQETVNSAPLLEIGYHGRRAAFRRARVKDTQALLNVISHSISLSGDFENE
jgi:hypothetical protein